MNGERAGYDVVEKEIEFIIMIFIDCRLKVINY